MEVSEKKNILLYFENVPLLVYLQSFQKVKGISWNFRHYNTFQKLYILFFFWPFKTVEASS